MTLSILYKLVSLHHAARHVVSFRFLIKLFSLCYIAHYIVDVSWPQGSLVFDDFAPVRGILTKLELRRA